MQCTVCSAVMPGDNRFCEDCGAVLPAAPAVPVGACLHCGAGPDAADADGYCADCGHRRPVPSDRVELVVDPWLGGVSDRGLRHHRNEDSFALHAQTESDVRILIVCDGVSSSANAGDAARTAASEACAQLQHAVARQLDASEALRHAFASALTAVRALPGATSSQQDTPSTTMVAALVQDDTVTIGWRGDSRAYWLDADASRQLTTDHSWINEVVTSGEMSEEEAMRSDNAHAITRWLGADCDEDSEPSITEFAMPGEGHLLLCSDGLWNYAPQPGRLAELVSLAEGEAAARARHLVEFARASGGRDNITAVLAQRKAK